MSPHVAGSLAALLSAFCWALGAVLWRRIGADLSACGMNLAKTVLGSLYLAALLAVVGHAPLDPRSAIYLGASGLVGIAVGDTLFFVALVNAGPRLATLISALNPVLIAVAAVAVLGERPGLAAGVGIVVTTGGVFWVLSERTLQQDAAGSKRLGVACGLLSVACTAVGVLLAKVGLRSIPAAEATLIRLLCGAAGLALWGLVRARLSEWVAPLRRGRLLGRVAAVVLLVVTGGFWLSLFALERVEASIAGPLNATAPLFVLPLVAVLEHERLTVRSVLGAVLAVGGVATILAGR